VVIVAVVQVGDVGVVVDQRVVRVGVLVPSTEPVGVGMLVVAVVVGVFVVVIDGGVVLGCS